jgi:hypothetical protein
MSMLRRDMIRRKRSKNNFSGYIASLTVRIRVTGKLDMIRVAILPTLSGALAMRNFGLRQIETGARILLICPDCGQENAQFADRLRAASTVYCDGDGCDYIFSLGGPRRTIGSVAEACRRFYASFYAVRRAR